MANQKIIERKAQTVSEIADRIKASNSVVLFEYRGLTVSETNQLRKISKQLQSIKMKLDNNQSQRSNDKNRNIEYEKYLKSFNIDIEKYRVVIEKEVDLDNVNL